MRPSPKADAIPAWSIGCRCSRTRWIRCSITSTEPVIAIEPLGEDAGRERFKQIAYYYRKPGARRWSIPAAGAIYKPLPPDGCTCRKMMAHASRRGGAGQADPFAMPDASADVIDAAARQGPNFYAGARSMARSDVFEAVVRMCWRFSAAQESGIAVERWARRDRNGEHAEGSQAIPPHQRQHLAHRAGDAAQRGDAGRARMEVRFRGTDDVAVISEQDIRATPGAPAKSSRKLDNPTRKSPASPPAIRGPCRARYRPIVGLQTLEVIRRAARLSRTALRRRDKAVPAGREYRLLSRYGPDHANVRTDRLGGSGWQARKAKLKNRIREIAGE